MVPKRPLWRRMLLSFVISVFVLGGILILIPSIYLKYFPRLETQFAEHTRYAQHQVIILNSVSSKVNFVTRISTNVGTTTSSLVTDESWAFKDIELKFTAAISSLQLPSIYYFLPHLLDNPLSLHPAHCVSKGRVDVSVVLGITTNKEERLKYLTDTLEDIIYNMTPEEAADTLIVVFVAEVDQNYVLQVSKQVIILFPEQVSSGLLEVLSPHASYYPDVNKTPLLVLPDSYEQQKKNAQNNLDICFLMMYAQSKGKFYVQLRSGIISKKNFISLMKNYTEQKSLENPSWVVLQFYQCGLVGTMFKHVHLPSFIEFLAVFHNDQPPERLLQDFISLKLCHSSSNEECKNVKAQFCLNYSTPLFQNNLLN